MEDLNHIGEKIKKIRKSKKISQELLAEKISMNYRSINRIENNHTIPTIETLYKIANALNVEIIDFFEPTIFKNKEKLIKKINEQMEDMNFDKLQNFYKLFSDFNNM